MDVSVSVLVVEDEASIQEVLDEALPDGGFQVTMTRSGEEAYAALDLDGKAYRAIVTDVNLSGPINGWDVARHARRINDRIPVLYISGGSIHQWGVNGVPNSLMLPKPFAIAQLVTAVAHLITTVESSP